MIKLRPTKRASQILDEYNRQVIANGRFGAMVNCAKVLKISRQCVEQIIKKFPQKLIVINEIEYITCKICECEVPKGLINKGICRDCKEQDLRHCPKCNTVYRLSVSKKKILRQICNSCIVKAHNFWQQSNKEYLNQKYRSRRSEYFRTYYAKKKLENKHEGEKNGVRFAP